MKSALNYFGELEERPRAHCAWCSATTENMPKRSVKKSKEFFEARVELSGLNDKARVCSQECANLWRDWAKNRLTMLNASFPAVAR